MILKDKTIILGVTASIAEYRALELISALKKEGCNIHIALTKEAAQFISPTMFKALTNNDVYCDVLEELDLGSTNITHIALADIADVFVVMPATANIIAKMASGVADDVVSLLSVSTHCPKIIAPAMNSYMYSNSIVQSNIEKLKNAGYLFAGPIEGDLACNAKGIGHIADTQDILDIIKSVFFEKTLTNYKIIVSAGPTQEAIDPVRYITNHSSGKMGFAIAKIAHMMGADVTLVSGPVHIKEAPGVKRVDVKSALDMLTSLKNEIEISNKKTVVIMASAVGDFAPLKYVDKKIKKIDNNNNNINLLLKKNPDLTIEIGNFAKSINKDVKIVGFAAETDDLIENATKKIKSKSLEFIVANDVSRKDIGFNSSENEVSIIYKNGSVEKLHKMEKDDVAYQILKRVEGIKWI